MSLQSLSNEDRIFFLLEFTESLIFNSVRDSLVKEKIEAEKIKQKYLEKNIPYENFGTSVIFKDYNKSQFEISQSNVQQIMPKPKIQFIPRPRPQKIETKPVIAFQKTQIKSSSQNVQSSISSTPKEEKNLTPMGKIDPLIKDLGVQLIECPGPGKNILVKVRNKINVTKITLSTQDIDAIINWFAQEAKIPIMNGILKAAVGDMVISAVSSQYVGSRFIITKKSPYSLIA